MSSSRIDPSVMLCRQCQIFFKREYEERPRRRFQYHSPSDWASFAMELHPSLRALRLASSHCNLCRLILHGIPQVSETLCDSEDNVSSSMSVLLSTNPGGRSKLHLRLTCHLVASFRGFGKSDSILVPLQRLRIIIRSF